MEELPLSLSFIKVGALYTSVCFISLHKTLF